jgi:hypothetical protein
MTARKTRRSRTGVTTEDAFGTPPAARGSMMNVAGKTDDELEPGEELLVDDGEENKQTEGRVIRVRLGALRRLVRTRMT